MAAAASQLFEIMQLLIICSFIFCYQVRQKKATERKAKKARQSQQKDALVELDDCLVDIKQLDANRQAVEELNLQELPSMLKNPLDYKPAPSVSAKYDELQQQSKDQVAKLTGFSVHDLLANPEDGELAHRISKGSIDGRPFFQHSNSLLLQQHNKLVWSSRYAVSSKHEPYV